MITYVEGDATQPIGDGTKIICHICNNIGGWGAGFVVALSRRWDEPETAYRSLDEYPQGMVQYVEVEDDIWVANMIAQQGVRSRMNPKPVNYNSVKEALTDVASEAIIMDASVHMPRIGCGLAGGNWGQIERIIQNTLVTAGIQVYVYDLI